MRFAAPDGTGLHYTDEGTGLPVIALAGLTRNGGDFDFVAPHLSGVRLIRLDYRGRGRSDWPGPETYTIPVEAQDVLALMDHLGLGRAAILGTSRGGLIGMTLAALAWDRLLGVCLNDVGPVIAPDGLRFIAQYLGRPAPFRTLADHAAARAAGMPGFTGVPESRWLEEAARMYDEGPDGLTPRYDLRLREAVLPGGAIPEMPDLWPLYDALAGLPMALIRGATSDLLCRETADEMRRRRPDLIFAEVPGRGHVPFLDEPEALRAIRKAGRSCPRTTPASRARSTPAAGSRTGARRAVSRSSPRTPRSTTRRSSRRSSGSRPSSRRRSGRWRA